MLLLLQAQDKTCISFILHTLIVFGIEHPYTRSA
jgi:hypothetical protein